VPGMALRLIFWDVVPEVKLSAVTGRKDDTNRATASAEMPGGEEA